MRTFAANANIATYASNAGSGISGFERHGASLLGALRSWYDATVAKARLANLPSHLLVDAFGEQASRSFDSHVRDGFGRPIY